jgi:HAD superfamily hydrolase (TIGR01509 family)
MSRYDAILFDFDGVLVDSEPVHFVCWQEILQPFGLTLDWKTYCEQGIGVSDRAMLAMLCKQSDPPLDIELLAAEYPRKKDIFRTKMLAAPSISRTVIDLLDSLADYKLAVVTSSGRNEVEPILEAAGIRSRFHAAVFGGDVKHLKPAPDPYRLAVERLGVSRALVIEDSEAGIASGIAAGLDVLRVPTQEAMPELVRLHLGL